MTGDAEIRLHKRAVVVMCADNGVVEEGVTQCDSSVTAVVAENFTKGAASVNHMSAVAGADVIPVDIGIAKKMEMPGLRDCKIAYGTQNMARGPGNDAGTGCMLFGNGHCDSTGALWAGVPAFGYRRNGYWQYHYQQRSGRRTFKPAGRGGHWARRRAFLSWPGAQNCPLFPRQLQ